jgi:A/G-specific adenine glycosylase
LATNNNIIFVNNLKSWYTHNQRDLPWRHTKDPYLIWLSEIILQQTRVAQGLPYYIKFVAAFPNITSFANAPEDEVLRLWQGLGYYSRARNMHFTAKYIKSELKGVFPSDYQTLIKLKGIGSYTAAAIASFSANEPVAVLDGNVYRVLSRYFGNDTDISSPLGKKVFSEIANSVLPVHTSADHNQAIMEFGALQCTPLPNCKSCPISNTCIAFAGNLQDKLPVKLKKIKVIEKYLYYFIFENEGRFFLKKRNNKGIWEGLFDFYLIEKAEKTNIEIILEEAPLQSIIKNGQIVSISNEIRHLLTHQKLNICFIRIKLATNESNFLIENDSNFYTINEIEELPKPIIIANYIENLNDFRE